MAEKDKIMGYNMKGFSGFGNSPLKQDTTKVTKKPNWFKRNVGKVVTPAAMATALTAIGGPVGFGVAAGLGLTGGILHGKYKKGGTVDPDAPGTPGKPGYEPPVKRSDLDEKGKKTWDNLRNKKK